MTLLEQKLELASKVATGSGSATAVASGLTLNELGVIVGIVVGIVGLITQLWFSWRRDRRERELHRLRMDDK